MGARKHQKFLYVETQDLFVKDSVRNVCDVNNFNYVDVLFSMWAQLYNQYIDPGKQKVNLSILQEKSSGNK